MSDVDVPKKIRWRGRSTVSFDTYARWESGVIDRLLTNGSAEPIEDLLRMKRSDQLPALRKATWAQLGNRMRSWSADEGEDDGFFCTVRWAASVLAKPRNGRGDPPQRPWAWTLERTAKRVKEPIPTRQVYGTWLADQLWAMSWAVKGTVYRTMADMTARYVVALRLADRFRRRGARADLAAAEAIMIVDTVGASEPWGWIERCLVEAPLGTY